MFSLSYLLGHGPQLLTNIIAWIGAALAFVAALAAWRAARTERSALIVRSIVASPAGATLVTVSNVGKRFALEPDLSIEPSAIGYLESGIAGGGEVVFQLPSPSPSPVVFKLQWTDADGAKRSSGPSFEFDGTVWRRVR